MADNVLEVHITELPFIVDDDLLLQSLSVMFGDVDKIYSYIVHARYDEYGITKWIIKYIISDCERYNTLSVYDSMMDIYRILTKRLDSQPKIIGYKQPPIEIMLEVFDPLINKLARQQYNTWRHSTVEDLAQDCRLVMMTLYKKGYYIHKVLLQKSFNNHVLMSLRKERNCPGIVSFEDVFYKSIKCDSETLIVADTIADSSKEEEQEEERIREAESAIFDEVRSMVIDLIGERQWKELVRDYSHMNTSTRTRKLMNKVKSHFEQLGLKRKDFNNKYYG